MVLTLNFKVVGNQVNRTTRYNGVGGLRWRSSKACWIATRRVAASSVWFNRLGIFPWIATGSAHGLLLLLNRILNLPVGGLLVLHVLGMCGMRILRILLAEAPHVRSLLRLGPWILRCVGIRQVITVDGVLVLVGLHCVLVVSKR